MKSLRNLCVMLLFIASVSFGGSSVNAETEEYFGPTCYCDTEIAGCWHNGRGGMDCSKRKNCKGGKCLPKTIMNIQ